jgi:hypothetical protein
VPVNTHKEFALEILMTMAPILDEGVPSFSFRLEGVEQVVPYDIRELLSFQKGAPKQVYVHGGTLEGFWSVIAEEPTNKKIVFGCPSSKFSLMDVQGDVGENERD